MRVIRTLIVDDEPLARTRIRELLALDREISVIGECSDGDEAVANLSQLNPDLVFLDVRMPERDGFEVISAMNLENLPVIVFVTAFDGYALKAFEVHALDYLLKPFDDSRFFQTLERAKRQVRQDLRDDDGSYKDLMSALVRETAPRQRFLEKILVKSDDRLLFVKTGDIDWINSEGNYACFHIGKASYMLRETISNLESQLDPEQFLRINRAVIINTNRVKELQRMFHGDYKVILENNQRFRLSRRFRDRLPRIATGS